MTEQRYKPLPYHRRWHGDVIAENTNLDLRERGALSTLIDLMFMHNGSVPDEDDFIRHYLGCNARGWHSLRDRLIDLQKIYRDDNGRLCCLRVDKELESIRQMRDAKAMAGMISQAKRQMTLRQSSSKVCSKFQKVSNFAPAKPLETLDSGSTPVQQLYTPHSRRKKEGQEGEENGDPHALRAGSPSPPLSRTAKPSEQAGSPKKEVGEKEVKLTLTPYLEAQIRSRRH
jgi:uncharacterized protein YdaU (DUF1376 family)